MSDTDRETVLALAEILDAEPEREHILSLDCWCMPKSLAYGDQLVYDGDGNLVNVRPGSSLDD